jgi:hypothetical protein
VAIQELVGTTLSKGGLDKACREDWRLSCDGSHAAMPAPLGTRLLDSLGTFVHHSGRFLKDPTKTWQFHIIIGDLAKTLILRTFFFF